VSAGRYADKTNDREGASTVLRLRRLLLVVITLGVAGQFASRSAVQSAAIEEARFLTLGGIEQWITVRGTNRGNPVLLFLHGGPGDAQSPHSSVYKPLEEDFVVVQWDQRGAGKTLAHIGASSRTTSLELLIQDAIALTRYLRDYLHTNDVILVGHSWGSFLGVHAVKRQPSLFRAFVGTAQVTTWRDMIQAQYRYALDRARAEPNGAAVAELQSLGIPVPDRFDQYLVLRRWLNRYLAPTDAEWIAKQDALLRAALSPDDLRAYRQGFQTMTGLERVVFSMDLPALGFDFKVPFFLIHGSADHIAPASLAASYFERIRTTSTSSD